MAACPQKWPFCYGICSKLFSVHIGYVNGGLDFPPVFKTLLILKMRCFEMSLGGRRGWTFAQCYRCDA